MNGLILKARLLFASGLYKQISEKDILEKQRYKLYFVFNTALFLICLAESIHAISFKTSNPLIGPVLQLFSAIALINHMLLLWHKRFRVAYYVSILTAFACVHIFNYYYGGIRNSGNFYYLVMIITTFMLLGNKEGKWMLGIAALNQLYFYYISDNPILITNVLSNNDSDLNQDFLFSTLMAVLAIAALSNSLGSSKNIVIERITQTRNDLAAKNKELVKLSLVASKTDSAVIITDEQLRTIWANEGFTRLTQHHSDDIKHLKIDDLLFGTQTDFSVVQQMHKTLNNKQSFTGELEQYRKDGSTYWAAVTVTPIKSESGAISKYVVIEDDITSRKQAEEQINTYLKNLEKTNKELDEFAYVVSHDLKAPLHAIANLTECIEEDMTGKFSEDTSNNFDIIKNRVARMEDLINGLFEYARANKNYSEKVVINLKAEIQDILNYMVADSNCEVQVDPNIPQVYGEKIKIQQVFSNLINNAIKYNDKESIKIDISYKDLGDFYEFTVADNGPGIDERFHEKIFVIFQTLNPRDSVESTGVGLAIVKKVIDEEGGHIRLESEKGMGCKFSFTWPKQQVTSTNDPKLELYH